MVTRTARSEACERFWKSTIKGINIDSREWSDDSPYDIAALAEMTSEERDEVLRLLHERPQDWREMQVYAALDTPDPRAALHAASRSKRAQLRLDAAEKLHDLGETIDLAGIVITELSKVTRLDGMTMALRLAARVPTAEVRRALLVGARRREEVGRDYAELLCALTGVAKAQYDWRLRPVLQGFGMGQPRHQRQAAFEELCRLTGMTPD